LLLGPILGVRFVWPVLLTSLIIPLVLAWKSATRWDTELTSSGLLVLQTIADQGLPEEQEDHTSRLSGLSQLRRVTLGPDSFAVGQSLTELQLRSLTGASVIGIANDKTSFLVPSGERCFEVGDVLMVAGSVDDQDAAEGLLLGGTVVTPERPSVPVSD